ncbi:hypothetical protein GGR54DRAFT_553544 [Hypoxylon sp. NC1633]|nr:hypothetical protein GGR54DRAFT_553544 [Hypoxylon sp. NC1633]
MGLKSVMGLRYLIKSFRCPIVGEVFIYVRIQRGSKIFESRKQRKETKRIYDGILLRPYENISEWTGTMDPLLAISVTLSFFRTLSACLILLRKAHCARAVDSRKGCQLRNCSVTFFVGPVGRIGRRTILVEFYHDYVIVPLNALVFILIMELPYSFRILEAGERMSRP